MIIYLEFLLQFTSEGCGRWKSCLVDPVGCNPSVDTSCFFLSYSTVSQAVLFELSGPAEGYVSFGLSKDEWMVSMTNVVLNVFHI